MSVRDDAKAFARSCVFLEDNGAMTLVWSPKVTTWGGDGPRFDERHVELLRTMIEGTYLYARRARVRRAKR